jgi:hypothetical protein
MKEMHLRTRQFALGHRTDLLDSLTRLMAAVQRHANEFSTRTEVAYVR